MNWYQQNPWLGNFVIVFATSLLLANWFLFHAKSEFLEASAQFNEVATERTRLEHLNPFPSEEDFRKTQPALENYSVSLNKTKEELKALVLPSSPLAPNEFQSRLRQAILDITEKARANRVKLPENFHFGFDEYTTALPDTVASPLLGQQLAQLQLLTNILIDNRVDEVTSLKRVVPPTQSVASSTPEARKPSGGGQQKAMIERNVVDLAFNASPLALRKVLNQIASSERQFFVIRTLHVRNEQQSGPSRDQTAAAASANTAIPTGAIKFIVGNEHLEAAVRIELIRFTF